MLRRIRAPEFRRRKIYSPEEIAYLRKDKKAKIATLLDDVVLCDKAVTAKEVVGAFLDTVEDDVLKALLSDDSDPQEVRLYYRAATKFTEMLNGFITSGEKKKHKINKLVSELKANKESE